jgi:hemerythrin-like metal-binding protein
MDWSPTYSVGVAAIDEQHQTLIAKIRALQEAMLEERVAQSLSQILSNLRALAQVHFTFEEGLMEAHAYREMAAHQTAHAELAHRLEELQRQLNAGNTSPSAQTIVSVQSWITHHITGLDRDLGAYLNLEGVR